MDSLSVKDKQGLALMAVVGLALIASLSAFFVLGQSEQLDDRGCPRMVEHKTVFLIDRSDNTPSQTIAEIRNRITKTIDSEVREGELVSIFHISDSAQHDLQPIFSMCKPKADGNELYENRRMIQKRFEASFSKPLQEALAMQASASEVSPLAEVMTDFLASDFLDAAHNRLVVFSDLMQNSDAVSLYSCTDDAAAIASYREARAGAIERPELRNVSVKLNLIPRQGIGSNVISCRERFWAWYFGDNEGPSAGVETSYLPGGATVQ